MKQIYTDFKNSLALICSLRAWINRNADDTDKADLHRFKNSLTLILLASLVFLQRVKRVKEFKRVISKISPSANFHSVIETNIEQ
jgi:hypothetical protein